MDNGQSAADLLHFRKQVGGNENRPAFAVLFEYEISDPFDPDMPLEYPSILCFSTSAILESNFAVMAISGAGSLFSRHAATQNAREARNVKNS